MENKKIKIMQITHDLNIGGLQHIVVEISRRCNNDEYEVSVCAVRKSGPLEKELKECGIKIFKLPSAPEGIDYFTFWKLYKIFKKESPHIIHTHNTQPLLEGGIARILARIPYHIHTDHGRQFPDKKRYMLGEKLLSNFVNYFVVVSKNLKKEISIHEKVKREKITVIPNGVDKNKFIYDVEHKNRKRKELGIDNRSPILGFVGRLSPEKGVSYLIRSMRFLVEDFPNVILLISGDGELLDFLKSEVKALSLEKNINFLGYRSDIKEILPINDVFVLPSLREGLPLALLEAIAASLPVVATDVGGNREVVRSGKNGFLVEPKDPHSLYMAIKQILINEDIKKSFSANSLRYFHENYLIDKMINQYKSIYKTLSFRWFS